MILVKWYITLAYGVLIMTMFIWTIYESFAVSEFQILVVPQPDEFEWNMSMQIAFSSHSFGKKNEGSILYKILL